MKPFILGIMVGTLLCGQTTDGTQPLPAFNVTDPQFGAVVGADASTAFIAAAKACFLAGGGSIGYPSFGSMFPWQVSVTLPLTGICSWWPAPNSELDETGAAKDLFRSQTLSGGSFVDVAGYSGGVVTNAYSANATGSNTGVTNGTIHCTGPCIFNGLIDSHTGTANNSKGINYYGTGLSLFGRPMIIKNFHGDGKAVDFNPMSGVGLTWGQEDIEDGLYLQQNGVSPTTGNIIVVGAVGESLGGSSDSRILNGESTQNACWGRYFGPRGASIQITHIHDGGVNTASAGCGNILNESPFTMFNASEVEGSVNGIANVVDLNEGMQYTSGQIFTTGTGIFEVPSIHWGQTAGADCYARSFYCSTPGSPTVITGGGLSAPALNNVTGETLMMFGNPGTAGHMVFDNENGGHYGGLIAVPSGSTAYVSGSVNLGSPDDVTLVGYGLAGCLGRITNCEHAVQSMSNGSTIFWLGPANIPLSRIPISATGAQTGIIIEAGGLATPQLTIINTSSFTQVLAASGSNVNPVNIPAGIPPGASTWTWDATNAVWNGLPNGQPPTYVTTTYSATPTFTATSNAQTTFIITLTGNVTSSTFAGGIKGQNVVFNICQDATGSRTFVFPTVAKGAFTIGATASKCSLQPFVWDGTNLYATSVGVMNQ